jgi:hypothetical protein
MPRGAATHALAHAAGRVPGLKRLPMLKLLALAEIALLARDHLGKLEPGERRRLLRLVRQGHGRPSHLSDAEREELARLVAKAEPRLFAGLMVDRLSPVPLPGRIVHGRSRRGGAPR